MISAVSRSSRKSALLASGIAAMLVIAGLAFAWILGSLVARPSNYPVTLPGLPGRVVQFRTADGKRIEASYWRGASPGGPAVVLLHGIGASRAMFDAHAA